MSPSYKLEYLYYHPPSIRIQVKAKIALSDLVLNKDITARSKQTDRYGRKVANIYVNDARVNSELVRQGFAWVYKKYSTDPCLPFLEDEAKETRKGLWGLPQSERIPPWKWRKLKKNKKNEITLEDCSQWACGLKSSCKQMTCCKEAMFYLNQCHVRKLDRDNDGIPCERLCR